MKLLTMTPRRFWLGLAALLATSFLIYKVTAAPGDPDPIDFDNGPLVTQRTPANVVLALSVEFPTSGGAYKDGTYVDGKEYVGYFNSSRCYSYPGYGSVPRTTSTFSINTDYFTPTGATNATYQCNTGGTGTGFSGNYLNYATMSAPDILRLALTGGDRGIDEPSLTVLDRGTVSPSGSAPFRRTLAGGLKNLVSPFPADAQNLYAYNCRDEVIFSTTNDINIARNCNAPNNGDPADLRPIVASAATAITTTVTPTVPPFNQVGTVWVDTGTYSTVVQPLDGRPTTAETRYTTTFALTTAVPDIAAESPAVVRTTTYAWTGGTTTVVPPTGAESPAVIRGGNLTGNLTLVLPLPVYESSPVAVTWTQNGSVRSVDYQGSGAPNVTQSVTLNHYVCHENVAPKIITRGPNTTSSGCGGGPLTRKQYTSAVNPRVIYVNYLPNFKEYTPYYRAYTTTQRYYEYTSYTVYKVYELRNVWNTFTSTAKSIVKPRVQVCDSAEGPTRTVVYGTGTTDFYNYCTKYTSGGSDNYKPEGKIQQKSDSIRLAVFSYLIDNQNRNGGVLRAPMKYTGPNKYDTNGSLIVNDEREWLATTGQFITKSISDSTSSGYTHTGVISYLNRFGKTGNYKTFDPIGELWYESLRYLQGLQPSDDATTGMTEPMKDGYPVYENWVDPITNACQRNNYILGIGDTNTHWDRTVPGITVADQTALGSTQAGTDKEYSTTPTIKGSATALNAHDWTKLIDAYERGITPLSYVDPLGRTQSTSGNPSPNTGLGNLDTTGVGAGSRSSYHWAGLSYWANTQPIRTDIINSQSTDKVRVKTFMIDVDENNQGSINANIQRTSYYLAGKYGYFNDPAQDGKPFAAVGASRWADPDGSPKGYVLASQPQRLIAGISKFFDESGGGGGSFAAIAVSSNSFSASSPDGKTYAPSFIPGQWSGTVKSFPLTLNTTTNSLSADASATWDAGDILTLASREVGTVTLPKVKPDDRKIFTYIAGSTPRGEIFTYAATNNGSDLPASFNQVPYSAPVVTDTLASARIDYLRGVRTKELDETFRPRQNIMGDIINSGPIYKGLPNERITDDGYASFFNASKGRVAAVYAGANDGMMHAFRADTGQELFAYIPGAVLGKLPNLTSKNYIHTAFVDAVPMVEEAKLTSGWRTVLASGMGGGAQGIFALDVTDPTVFDKNKVMFEFTDKDDRYMGNVTGQPQIVKIRDANNTTSVTYKYFMVVSSGYNNYKPDGTGTFVTTSDQALFFLDLSKPTPDAWLEGSNYYKVILPATLGTKTNGLAQPGIRYGSAGEAIEFFSGDLQGNIWKIAFEKGINAAAVLDDGADEFPIYKGGGTKKPLFTAEDAGLNKQAITSSPVVYPSLFGGNMVIFGTGRLLESTDRSSTATQSIYGIWDSGQTNANSYSLKRNKLETLTMNSVTLSITGNTPTFANTAASKRGWYFDLTRANERVVIDAVAATGVVNINSTIPPSSICSDNGDGLKYFLSPSYGKDVLPTEPEGGGYLGRSTVVDIDISTATNSSYSDRTVSGRRTATKKEAILTQRQGATGTVTTTQNINVTYLATGRIYWREVRDFNRTNP
jgi:type IV pilus assembly protein PilY1